MNRLIEACRPLLVGGALLSSSLSANAAVFEAHGTNSFVDNLTTGIFNSYSLTEPFQAGDRIVFSDNNPNTHDITLDTSSLASGGGLHSHSYAKLITQPGYTTRYEVNSIADAIATFQDVVVTGPAGGSILTSFNLDLSGTNNAGASGGAGALALANSQVSINLNGNGNFAGSGTYYYKAHSDGAAEVFSNGILSGWPSANAVTSLPFNILVGVPFTVRLELDTTSQAQHSAQAGVFPPGSTAEANTDFSNTLTFALSGAVFNLPAGYTANSVEAGIVNNVFISTVPEPSDAVLVAFSVFTLCAFRRTRRADRGGEGSVRRRRARGRGVAVG